MWIYMGLPKYQLITLMESWFLKKNISSFSYTAIGIVEYITT